MKAIEIELSTRCTIKCPACPRTKSPGQIQERPSDNWNVGFLDKELLFKLFHEHHGMFNFCGAYGDPIYHPDFIEIIKKLIENQKMFNIETNGSRKTSNFWYEVSDNNWDKFKPQQFTFSIDGLKNTNHIYRKNSDWDSIEKAISILTKNNFKPKLIWKFIVFPYNIHQVEEAQKMSINMGFDKFNPVKSLRNYNPLYFESDEERWKIDWKYFNEKEWKS